METLDFGLIGSALLLLLAMSFAAAQFFGGRRFIIDPWQPPAVPAAWSAEHRARLLDQEIERETGGRRVETPRGFVTIAPLSEDGGIAQQIGWKWQQRSLALLELGRVTDTMLHAEALAARLGAIRLFESVSLNKVRRPWFERVRSRGLKGQADETEAPASLLCVVVRTRRPRAVGRILRSYGGWLGQGVAVERALGRSRQFGRCEIGGASGGKGQVGGYLRTDAGEYGVTCAHVLTEVCASQAFRMPLQAQTDGPDIGVIRPTRCFPSLGNPRQCHPRALSERDIMGPITIRMTPHARVRGRIESISLAAFYEGRRHSFPHLQIIAEVGLLFDLLYWPPWKLFFSRRGDSGSWAVTEDGAEWLGVVAGGRPFARLTYAVLADPLLDFLDRRTGIDRNCGCFIEGE